MSSQQPWPRTGRTFSRMSPEYPAYDTGPDKELRYTSYKGFDLEVWEGCPLLVFASDDRFLYRYVFKVEAWEDIPTGLALTLI